MPLLRSIGAFAAQPLEQDVLLGVAGTRILWVDHAAIRRDLGTGVDGGEIEQWLLRETSFVSRPQAAQSHVNGAIATTGRERIAHRPPRYCRAAIIEARLSPRHRLLLDVKGCGIEPSDVPALPSSNGLLTLSEAVHELVMERLTRTALEHAGSRAATVPIYAIVDLGFEARFHGRRRDERAVLLVRRAQTRPEFQWGRQDPGRAVARELMEIELTLRRYGITASSCGAIRFVVRRNGQAAISRDGRVIALPAERLTEICDRIRLRDGETVINGVNVQVSEGIFETPPRPAIFDFGRYRLQAAFSDVLYAAWDRDFETLRGEFLPPFARRYVQPDARCSMAAAFDDPAWAALQNAIGARDADRVLLSSCFDAFISRATAALPRG